MLFTWDAFRGVESLPLPGPVFVHQEACARYPEDGGFPVDLAGRALTLNAYGPGRTLLAREHVNGGNVDDVVERLLATDGVAYIHVRDTKAGCYDFRIDRAA